MTDLPKYRLVINPRELKSAVLRAYAKHDSMFTARDISKLVGLKNGKAASKYIRYLLDTQVIYAVGHTYVQPLKPHKGSQKQKVPVYKLVR